MKLLLVDDHPEGRTACARLLGSLGHQVDDTGEPAEAEDFMRAAAAPYAVVVLDLYLGEMDGMTLLTRLEALGGPLRVLFISGDNDAVRELRANQRPGMAVIEKPFTAEDLQAALDELGG